MHKLTILTIVAALLLVHPSSSTEAQGVAPSGPNPFAPLVMPVLATPTPIATSVFTATPGTPTATPTATGTSAPAATMEATFQMIDGSGVLNQMQTLQYLADQPIPVIEDAAGNPIDLAQTEGLAANASGLFSFFKSISTVNVGFLTPFLTLLILKFSIQFTFQILGFLVPVIAAFVGIVRKGISLIMDFIPG